MIMTKNKQQRTNNKEQTTKNLIDREELEAWTETVELLKDPNLLADIESARKEYEEGETFTMNEVF